MNNQALPRLLSAVLLTGAAFSASAQSANFNLWTKAGDAQIGSPTAVTLTTAAVGSGEVPVSGSSALLPDELALALSLSPPTLAADTYEGSGIKQSFSAAAGTAIRFSWTLSTVGFDSSFADRAFVVIDGTTVMPLGTVTPSVVAGNFNYSFSSAGSHALAIVVMDVGDSTAVSTLAISNLQVTAVPEASSVAMLLSGLALIGAAVIRRRV